MPSPSAILGSSGLSAVGLQPHNGDFPWDFKGTPQRLRPLPHSVRHGRGPAHMIDVPLDQSKLAVVGGRHPIGGEGSGGRAQAGSAALPAVPPATRGRWRHSGVPAR